ncbi:MAG: phosphatidate cytidylyltransferase [Chitinophagaceae bacterium]
MKSNLICSMLLALGVSVLLQSCAIAGGIFKAGVWVGILIVVLVIGGIIALMGRKK